MLHSSCAHRIRLLCTLAAFIPAASIFTLSAPAAATAQEMTDDMVGQNEKAWQTWHAAMTAIEKDQKDDGAKKLDEVAAMKLSPLRLALMADRTGTLRLEQMVQAGELGESGKAILDQVTAGRKQKMLAEDGWHTAAVGRFEMADANFKALVDSNPDPVALLELARYNPNRHTILLKIMSQSEVGPSARAFLDVLGQGEELLRQDPQEITVNIEKLAGTPRMVHNATVSLKASGEYAIPHLIRYLQDPAKADLRIPIIKLLPQIGRAALNPTVVALDMPDQSTRLVLVEALGEIGYKQSLPYLARIAENSPGANADAQLQDAARAAMRRIDAGMSAPAASMFHDLAEAYNRDTDSIRADPRLSQANAWYYRDDRLIYVPVPREIFNDIMAMRCCEAALKLNPDMNEATALWIASNFRRESKLGLNPESEDADPLAAKDGTRPDNYPRSIYFARAAGPQYNHLVLSRAVAQREPGVALGAIAALAATAGEGSLLGAEDFKQSLAESLTFPSRLVRIKAALAVSRARPESQFNGSQNVSPVLNEALVLSARSTALVVVPDDAGRNKAAAVLRAGNMHVVDGAQLYATVNAAREQKTTHFDVVLLGSDVTDPDLEGAVNALRGDFMTAATPIVIMMKPRQTAVAQRLMRTYSGVVTLGSEVIEGGTPEEAAKTVQDRYARAAATFGIAEMNPELALALSLEAADVLRLVAVSGSNVIDFGRTEPGLITALTTSPSESLRIKAAGVLALIDTATAQEAIAQVAVDSSATQTMRVAAYASLAESARKHGNKLGQTLVSDIIEQAMNGDNLVIRTASSQALGALNLPSNRASEIIRAQSRG